MFPASTRCPWRLLLILPGLVGLAVVVMAPAAAEGQETSRPPNVVIFLSDDQGSGDFSIAGNRDLNTPHIDRLAQQGALVEQFFVCPVCSPTRAEFLTGRYHPRGGVFSTSTGGERLDLDETTIAQHFQQQGYATAAFGKWHNGMQPPYHPNARGFDEFYGFCSGHWGHYFSPLLEHNNQLVTGQGFVIDDFTSRAIEFIRQHRQQPFFVYLPYCTPHSPMQVPDPYWERFAAREITQSSGNPRREVLSHTRAALAMCENIDDNVGRVLQTLDQLQLQDNTIVVYFCDNGPNGWRYNQGLKGKKGSTDEGGVRSPLFVRFPAQIPPGTRPTNIAGAIDLLPTLMELCGQEFVPAKPLDGVSIAADLRGEAVERDRMIFSHWNDKVSVRTNQFRLDHSGQLFDMQQDPGQTRPLVDLPGVRQRLIAAAQAWRESTLSELDRSPRPFPVGHPDFEWTQLPARDAEATGAIERSSRHPNCSYFRNWVSANDTIAWPIEVLQAGRYRAELHYCLGPQDTGVQLELAGKGPAIAVRVTHPHQSPEIGEAEDRSPRTESFVKDFRPLEMGVLELPAGRQTLTLRTIDLPGKESIEFRLLTLQRVE